LPTDSKPLLSLTAILILENYLFSCIVLRYQSSRKKHLLLSHVGHVRYYGESNYLICQPLADNFYIIFIMLAIYGYLISN
jgi:hypothetical protein